MVVTTQKQRGRGAGTLTTPTTRCDDTALVNIRGSELVTNSLTIGREFGRNHKDVLRTLDSLIADGTIDGRNFAPVEYVDAKGEKRRMIELDERGALTAMPFVGGRKSRTGQVRLVDAFLAQRRELKAAHTLATATVPQSLPEALRLAADLAEVNGRLEQTVAHQAPKVAALDRLAAADGSMCPTDAAKALKVAPRALIAWLDRNSWTYRRGVGAQIAYQALIMRGLLEHASRTIELKDGSSKVVSAVRVTPKGLTELARLVAAGSIPMSRGAQ